MSCPARVHAAVPAGPRTRQHVADPLPLTRVEIRETVSQHDVLTQGQLNVCQFEKHCRTLGSWTFVVKRLVGENKLPHLLFYGPPGTGKTSTILAVARQIYGASFQSMVLELNASDDRGIGVVRQQVQDFASSRTLFGCDSTAACSLARPCIPHTRFCRKHGRQLSTIHFILACVWAQDAVQARDFG